MCLVGNAPDILPAIDALSARAAEKGPTPCPKVCVLCGKRALQHPIWPRCCLRPWISATLRRVSWQLALPSAPLLFARTPTRRSTCSIPAHHQTRRVLPTALDSAINHLITRSLQRHLTYFTRVCARDDAVAPLAAVQVAAKDAVLTNFYIQPRPAICLTHELVRQQLRPLHCLGGFAPDPMAVSVFTTGLSPCTMSPIPTHSMAVAPDLAPVGRHLTPPSHRLSLFVPQRTCGCAFRYAPAF